MLYGFYSRFLRGYDGRGVVSTPNLISTYKRIKKITSVYRLTLHWTTYIYIIVAREILQ